MKQSLIWLLAILTPIATYSQEANPHRSKTLLAEKGLFTPTKYCIYNINSIEDGGTLLTLQDGSEWHIALNTSHITPQWLHDDPIIISLPSFDTVCPYKMLRPPRLKREQGVQEESSLRWHPGIPEKVLPDRHLY